MEDQTLNQKPPYNPKHVRTAIIVLIILFFVITITFTISNPLLHHGSIVPITTDTAPYLNDKAMVKIESSVKSHLATTYNMSPDELNNSFSIVIRENTLTQKQDSTDSFNYAKFIIDLTAPKYSYMVIYKPSSNSVRLTCPTIDQVQDPNLFCIAHDGHSTIDANLDQYLPYQGTTASDIDFSISHHSEDSSSDPYLSIYASVCGDETAAAEVESAVKDWIRSHGIDNPDIIPLHFPHSYCNDRN